MGGMEEFGWCILAMMLPCSVFIGIGLAVWEYEYGTPKWLNKLAEWLIKLSDKFLL